MQLETLSKVFRYMFLGIILLFIVLINIDHSRYPEKYQITTNVSRFGYDLNLEEPCECQEKVVLETIMYWINIMKLFFIPMAVLFIAIGILERPGWMEKIKNWRRKED